MRHTTLLSRLLPLTGLSLACAVAQAAPTCPFKLTTVSVDASKLTVSAEAALANAIAAIPANSSGQVNLTGTFSIRSTVPVRKSCITFNSVSSTAPAVLRWATPSSSDTLFILDNADPNGSCLATASCVTPHHVKVNGLIFEDGGIRLDGYAPSVINSQFKRGATPLSLQFTDTATVKGNTFTDTPGIASWDLKNSLISTNTFTRAIQPVSVAGSSINNTIESNQGTGSVMFSIELLGANNTLGANARNVNNKIRYNTFSAPSAPTPGNHGAFGGISLASGTGNTISNNNLSCPAICNAYGIEAAGVNSTVSVNTVNGYHTGVYVGESQPGNPSTDTTKVDGNIIGNVTYGVVVGCAPGAANGTDTVNTKLAGCRKTVNITNNKVTEPQVLGIGGFGEFFTRYTLDSAGNRVLETYPGTSNPMRYRMSTVSELRALTIQGNVITRTYGQYADDTDNSFDGSRGRLAGISLGPILVPSKLLVDNNQITLNGTPPSGDLFGLYGVSLGLSVLHDVGGCVQLPGSQNFSGSKVTNNTVTHNPTNVAFGALVRSTCNASRGVILSGNKVVGGATVVLEQ